MHTHINYIHFSKFISLIHMRSALMFSSCRLYKMLNEIMSFNRTIRKSEIRKINSFTSHIWTHWDFAKIQIIREGKKNCDPLCKSFRFVILLPYKRRVCKLKQQKMVLLERTCTNIDIIHIYMYIYLYMSCWNLQKGTPRKKNHIFGTFHQLHFDFDCAIKYFLFDHFLYFMCTISTLLSLPALSSPSSTPFIPIHFIYNTRIHTSKKALGGSFYMKISDRHTHTSTHHVEFRYGLNERRNRKIRCGPFCDELFLSLLITFSPSLSFFFFCYHLLLKALNPYIFIAILNI